MHFPVVWGDESRGHVNKKTQPNQHNHLGNFLGVLATFSAPIGDIRGMCLFDCPRKFLEIYTTTEPSAGELLTNDAVSATGKLNNDDFSWHQDTEN